MENKNENELISYLFKNGVQASIHYQPLHTSKAAKKFGLQSEKLPVTETVSDTLLRLPIYAGISKQAQFKITDLISKFFARQ